MDEKLLIAIQEAATTISAPNWAVALSAIAAVIAVFVAVAVAIKQMRIAEEQTEITKRQNEIAQRQVEITERQNKIALFKERYTTFCEFRNIISLGEIAGKMKTDITDDERSKFFQYMLSIMNAQFRMNLSSEKCSAQELADALSAQISLSEYQIRQAIFLFQNIEENDINCLINVWSRYMAFLAFPKGTSHPLFGPFTKVEFCTQCEQFSNKYMKEMEEMLNLK